MSAWASDWLSAGRHPLLHFHFFSYLRAGTPCLAFPGYYFLPLVRVPALLLIRRDSTRQDHHSGSVRNCLLRHATTLVSITYRLVSRHLRLLIRMYLAAIFQGN